MSTHLSRRYRSFLAGFVFLSACWLTAQQSGAGKAAKVPVTGTSASTATASTSASQDLLKVTISSSRTSVTRDGSYGVYADLENVAPNVVTIRPAETVLVVQPEVAQPDACVEWEWGIFPVATDPKLPELRIQPGEHYKVFWNLTKGRQVSNGSPGQGQSRTQGTCPDEFTESLGLGFVPGEYAFTVEGIVYASNSAGIDVPHTYTETTSLHVGISQIATAIAAFFGAILAYFVVALQPGRDFDKWRPDLPVTGHLKIAFVVIRNVFSAGLLGAAVTIVASRLSDTQFPVKVSVNDFWGALTIGFVAYFMGSHFILSLANRFAPPSGSPSNGKHGPGNPVSGSSGSGGPTRENPAQNEPSAEVPDGQEAPSAFALEAKAGQVPQQAMSDFAQADS